MGQRDAASILELFEPLDADWLNVGRSISMANDGSWTFKLGGTEQSFEDPDSYKQKRVKDRFPIELLDRYLQALGIYAFDPGFYLPEESRALLLEKAGSFPKTVREFGLQESFSRNSL